MLSGQGGGGERVAGVKLRTSWLPHTDTLLLPTGIACLPLRHKVKHGTLVQKGNITGGLA